MKQNRVSQKERERILQMYGSKYLNEETTGNKTIRDIQALVGNVKVDNILGPQTLAAIKAKLGQPDKSTTPSVDGLTYKDLIDVGWTDEQIGKSSKYKSLLPTKTETTPSVDGLTYKDLIDVGWTDEQIGKSSKYKSLLPKETEQKTVQGFEPIKIDTLKVKSLTKAPTPDGLQVGVEKTGGEQTKVQGTDDKQVIDSTNP